MPKMIDLTGQRYGNLIVIRISENEPCKKKKWLCKCDCGANVIVSGSNLRSGHTKHCKKCGNEVARSKKIKHGMTGTKLYYVWEAMINRCGNPNSKSYVDYGAKGISVCDDWHDASVFIKWALENGYKEGLEIDRIDTFKGYSPDNCRWVTKQINANNKTINKYIEHNGKTRTLADWARYYEVNYKNLSRNMNKGYSLQEAIKREKTGDRSHRYSTATGNII